MSVAWRICESMRLGFDTVAGCCDVRRVAVRSLSKWITFEKATPLRRGFVQLLDCARLRMILSYQLDDPNHCVLCRAIDAGRSARHSHGREWRPCHA